MRGKNGCYHATKAGLPCPAPAVYGSRSCMAHAPASLRISLGFVGKNGKQTGRPRVKGSTELLREMVADNLLTLLDPHLKTLGVEAEVNAEGKIDLAPAEPVAVEVKVGKERYYDDENDREEWRDVYEQRLVPAGARLSSSAGGYVNMSPHEDLGAKMKAADGLIDRGFGKPRQTTELTGPDGGPLQIEAGVMPTGARSTASQLARELAAG